MKINIMTFWNYYIKCDAENYCQMETQEEDTEEKKREGDQRGKGGERDSKSEESFQFINCLFLPPLRGAPAMEPSPSLRCPWDSRASESTAGDGREPGAADVDVFYDVFALPIESHIAPDRSDKPRGRWLLEGVTCWRSRGESCGQRSLWWSWWRHF